MIRKNKNEKIVTINYEESKPIKFKRFLLPLLIIIVSLVFLLIITKIINNLLKKIYE